MSADLDFSDDSVLVYTNEVEKAQSEGVSYLDCFRGVELRRTEITCMCFVAQTMCGSALGGLQSCESNTRFLADTQSFTRPLVSLLPVHTTLGLARRLSALLERFVLGRSVSLPPASKTDVSSRQSRSTHSFLDRHGAHLFLADVSCSLSLR